MLMSWEFDYYNENGKIEMTRTSQQLVEEVYHPISMHQIIENRSQDEFVRNLFVQERENYFNSSSPAVRSPVQKDNNAIPENDEEDGLLSIILSVKDGYGFIEDRAINNVFFHYNSVENADFNDLKPGMKVRYFREEDEERSKLDDSPRYRATKVFILG
jgi:cold shock CspA family protein